MILRALYDLAMREELVSDPDFPLAPVAWLVTVSREGAIRFPLGDTRVPEQGAGKRKPRLIAKSFPVPRPPGRTSGDRAFFFCDKSEYALGLACTTSEVPARPAEKLSARFTLFREQIAACVEATGDDGARAVSNALQAVAAGQQRVHLPDDCAPNDLFAFIYEPDGDTLVHERPEIQAYWRAQRREVEVPLAARFRCLVTGEPMAEPENFPKVKNVPGGQSSGVPLISFNARAFESYGLAGNENAPISRAAAEACATALQRLLHPAFPDPRPAHRGSTLLRRHVRISDDTVVCYWSNSTQADPFLDALASILDGADEGEVGEMYRSVWSGRPAPVGDAGAFYALTLSGAQGRMIVRDWFESSVAGVSKNLARHFQDLSIVRNTPAPKGRELPSHLPLHVLVGALAPLGKRENIPASVASEVVRAALQGTPYPFSILQRAIERARAEVGKIEWSDLERRDARAALIKAVLLRTLKRKVTPAVDTTNTNPGYLCGRLMAIIERLQQVALGDVNASVVDRYFGAASATPRAVFVRLLRNTHHHARKAQDDPTRSGTAAWLKRQIDEIASRFDPKHNGFPAFLDLEQQGLFILGYHQQRYALWARKAPVAAASEPEETVAASAI